MFNQFVACASKIKGYYGKRFKKDMPIVKITVSKSTYEVDNMDDQQVEDIVKCPECGSRSLTRDETRGEVTCDDCGLVLEDNVIDQGAVWRVFSPEQGEQ